MSASIADLLQKCLENEQNYKLYAESIAQFVADPTKNM